LGDGGNLLNVKSPNGASPTRIALVSCSCAVDAARACVRFVRFPLDKNFWKMASGRAVPGTGKKAPLCEIACWNGTGPFRPPYAVI
jgi:hypothetical protein